MRGLFVIFAETQIKMKPKIFIGSSVESLEIAHNIQELLEHEANPTVWTQGIFELSNTALEDLIRALDSFDYAIFIFKPEDVSTIRDKNYNTVRDNVIFELGLFIGKLGKDKVFFVTPKNTKDFHLPSDLAGITYGTYDADRDDQNILAALGPFCNQIRRKLKDFKYNSLKGFENESKIIKDILVEKKIAWEFKLAAEFLKEKLKGLQKDYEKLQNNIYYKTSRTLDYKEYCRFMNDKMRDFLKLMNIFTHTYNIELYKSFGETGVAGDPHAIKASVESLEEVCSNLFDWEAEVLAVSGPDEAEMIPIYIKGWTKVVFDRMNELPDIIYARTTAGALKENENTVDLNFEKIKFPNQEEVFVLMNKLIEKIKREYS